MLAYPKLNSLGGSAESVDFGGTGGLDFRFTLEVRQGTRDGVQVDVITGKIDRPLDEPAVTRANAPEGAIVLGAEFEGIDLPGDDVGKDPPTLGRSVFTPGFALDLVEVDEGPQQDSDDEQDRGSPRLHRVNSPGACVASTRTTRPQRRSVRE